MTPRQIMAYLILVDRRMRIEKASDLNLNAIASRSDQRTIGEITKSLLGRR